jgi:hypothetical protein
MWSLTLVDEHKLHVFETNVPGKVSGPKYEVNSLGYYMARAAPSWLKRQRFWFARAVCISVEILTILGQVFHDSPQSLQENDRSVPPHPFQIAVHYSYCDICQPIVVLRSRALLGSRPVNKISSQTRLRHAAALEYGSCATSRDDVTRQHARFRVNAVVNTVTWRNRVDWLCFSCRWFWLYKRSGLQF